jgi:outer membrane protein insertion porin family
VYNIEEARLGQIGAGLGYSVTEKLMFNFSVSQENFFGTGKMVDFTFDKSKSASNYAFGYQDPYFTADGIGMGVSAFYNKSHLSKTTDVSDYITDVYGAQQRFIFPLSKYETFSLSYGYDNTHLKVSPRAALELTSFINQYGGIQQEVTVGFGWQYNSLNTRIFPTCGLSQNLGFSIVVPGANLQYYKASYDFTWYYPLTESERWIVNLSSTLGYGNGYGKTPTLPFYRHYYAGGTRFVRGFEENSLGPRDSLGRAFGGNALVAGTAALIFPNPIKPDAKSVRTALFFDAGQVYDTRNQVVVINGQTISHKVNGLRYSVGVSLTWHSPLGAPLTFALAKPLNMKPGDQRRTFTFWMGTQF